VLGVIAFSVSALILNYVLRRADLVPRWLASWGLAGAVLYLATAAMVLYGLEPLSATQNLLQAPLGIQEMVFAIWLIVKGFNPAARSRRRSTRCGRPDGTSPASAWRDDLLQRTDELPCPTEGGQSDEVGGNRG
jgi:Domain of unknown function (DUF4386)